MLVVCALVAATNMKKGESHFQICLQSAYCDTFLKLCAIVKSYLHMSGEKEQRLAGISSVLRAPLASRFSVQLGFRQEYSLGLGHHVNANPRCRKTMGPVLVS